MENIFYTKEEKEIFIDNKKYTSIVELKVVKDLYQKIYNLLVSEFDKEIVKDKLKIKEIVTDEKYGGYKTVSISLDIQGNKGYEIVPIEKNKSIYFIRDKFWDIEKMELKTYKGEFIFNDKKLLNIFKISEFYKIKEGLSLKISEGSFTRNIYLKAMYHYEIALTSKEKWVELELMDIYKDKTIVKKYTEAYFRNNIIAASKYAEELSEYNIKNDKENFFGAEEFLFEREFLVEVYVLKQKIEMEKERYRECKNLENAFELNKINQNLLFITIKEMSKSIETLNINNLDNILNYLKDNIKYIELDEGSIIYKHIDDIINENVLKKLNYKKILPSKLMKVSKIYYFILKEIEKNKLEHDEKLYLEFMNVIEKYK